MSDYKVTYMVNEQQHTGGWGFGSYRTVKVPLKLNLDVYDGVGGCCAVGSLSDFFHDDDFKRHKADHHYVTVKAIKEGCKELMEKGCSVAYATINTEQKLTESCLIEAGFTCTTDGWCYRNPKHSTTRTGVKVFTKPLHKVLKRSPRG